MIVRTPNGAVLEMFWRQRGVRPWSQVTALRYLSRFRAGREGLSGLRWLLAERVNAGDAFHASDDMVLQRAAWLVASEQVLVAQFGFSERWPGSGFVLGSGQDSPLLFWRDQLSLERDLHHAVRWIDHVVGLLQIVAKNKLEKKDDKKAKAEQDELNLHSREVQRLRLFSNGVPGVPDFSFLDDLDFLKQIRKLLESGDLIPIYHRLPMPGDPKDDVDPNVDPPPKPGPGPKDEPDDPNTFDPDNNLPSQILCLLKSASNGNPFLALTDSKQGKKA